MHCRPLQRTCYTESGMNLITVWMCDPGCTHWRIVINAWETWRVAATDGVGCARVRWEINFLLTFETAPFFCVYPVQQNSFSSSIIRYNTNYPHMELLEDSCLPFYYTIHDVGELGFCSLYFWYCPLWKGGGSRLWRHYGKYDQTTPQYSMVSMNSEVGLFVPEVMEYSQTWYFILDWYFIDTMSWNFTYQVFQPRPFNYWKVICTTVLTVAASAVQTKPNFVF
jgi:hypothetical protein